MRMPPIALSLASRVVVGALRHGLERLEAALWDGGDDLDADLPVREGGLRPAR